MGNPTFEEYVKDKRIACKYGYKCYQKSDQHHEKYKHPPKPHEDKKDLETEQAVKKRKVCTSDEETKDIKIYNSDSTKVENKESTSSSSEEKKATAFQKCKESEKGSKELNPIISLEEAKQFIKDKFLVEMPDDFYYFWDFVKSVKPKDPLNCFYELGLVLVGPFDVLAGKFQNIDLKPELYLIHWRYFHDPPEFQTVLKESRDKNGFHIGYFRDSPQEKPVFLASNNASEDGTFSTLGENIFTVIDTYLMNLKETGNPFERAGFRKRVSKIRSDLKEFAKAKNIELGLTNRIDARQKKTVARSLNKLGIVVPYNKKTQLGYRELPVDKKALKKLLMQLRNANESNKQRVLSEFQPILTAVNIALDECDFGTGIELGWDLLSQDLNTLNSTITQFLSAAYRSLGWDAFAQIISAHMDNRRKGCNLSVLKS